MTLPETHTFEDARGLPFSRLPVLVYQDVEGARAVSECEELFARNGVCALGRVRSGERHRRDDGVVDLADDRTDPRRSLLVTETEG